MARRSGSLDEKSFGKVDGELSVHGLHAAHDLLLVAHEGDADVDELEPIR
jgi:hypothetical protein